MNTNLTQAFATVEDALRGVLPGIVAGPDQAFERGEYGPKRDRRFISSGNAMFDKIVRNSGARFQYGADDPGTGVSGDLQRGQIIPNDPEVTWIEMPPVSAFFSREDYISTVAHELVHWSKVAGVAPRPVTGFSMFDRMMGLLPAGYAEEELVAEIGAALLLEAVGEDPQISRRANYIKGWMTPIPEDRKDSELAQAFDAAREAVEALLKFAN